jgi:hypothetical protein
VSHWRGSPACFARASAVCLRDELDRAPIRIEVDSLQRAIAIISSADMIDVGRLAAYPLLVPVTRHASYSTLLAISPSQHSA